MAEFPVETDFDYSAATTNTEHLASLKAFLQTAKQLPGAQAQSELTISSGSITPTRTAHSVDTESDAASDDLASIGTGLPDGSWLLLRPENTARVVTVKHAAGGVGEIVLDGAADYVMDKTSKTLVLQRVGAQWLEIFRTGWDDAEAGGQQLFTASGDFTVPAGITRVYVTAVSGGGGGGGGAGATGTSPDASASGSDGVAGTQSSFGGSVIVAGGSAGKGGSGLGRGGQSFEAGCHGQNKSDDLGGYGGVSQATMLGNYGRGGNGGKGADGTSGTAGGGGGAGCGPVAPSHRKKVDSLTPLGTVAVTVGAGGAGGAAGTGAEANGVAGSNGVNGAVLVGW